MSWGGMTTTVTAPTMAPTMESSQALARLSDMATKGALPFAFSMLSRMRGQMDTWVTSLLGRDFDERIRLVSEQLGPDPFGWDPDYAKYVIAFSAVMHRMYFRTVVRGVENLPPGRVLVVANHSGQIPLDGVIAATAGFLDANPPRMLRAMVEKWSQTLPFVSTFFTRCGQVVGVPENAVRLLERGEAILVFPEGTRGLSKSFGQRYQLTDFGLGFMRLALETDTPIVPLAIVGAEEQYISMGNMRSMAKLLRIPYFPVVPQIFLPGGQFPLPTKYRLYFGEPLRFQGDHDDEDAAIEEKVWVVKATIQSMVNRGLKERKNPFW